MHAALFLRLTNPPGYKTWKKIHEETVSVAYTRVPLLKIRIGGFEPSGTASLSTGHPDEIVDYRPRSEAPTKWRFRTRKKYEREEVGNFPPSKRRLTWTRFGKRRSRIFLIVAHVAVETNLLISTALNLYQESLLVFRQVNDRLHRSCNKKRLSMSFRQGIDDISTKNTITVGMQDVTFIKW